MDREDAIAYLQRKGEIKDNEVVKPKFNKYEEDKIKDVMKHGKIYGDPVAEVY